MKSKKNKLDWENHFPLKKTVALILVLALFSFLFISLVNLGPNSESTPRQGLSFLEETFADGWSLITGADIAIPVIENETVNNSAEGDNQPPEIDLPIDNSSIEEPAVDEMNETIEDYDNQTEEGLVGNQNLATQATCNVWPCNCGDSLNVSVTLNSSLTCSSFNNQAINIANHNIVLDCAGYDINDTGAAVSAAISNGKFGGDGYNNVTIKNCRIFSNGRGIKMIGLLLNATVNNNTINATNHGVYLFNVRNSTISNNYITSRSDDSIESDSSILNNFMNNIINNTIVGGEGIDLSETNQSNISNNLIITNSTNGIYIGTESNLNNINNNTINAFSPGYGAIEIEDAHNTTVTNNTITTEDSHANGIRVDSSGYTLIKNNKITVTGHSSEGIEFWHYNKDYASEPESVINNMINTSGYGGHGINIKGEHTIFTNLTNNTIYVYGEGAYGINDADDETNFTKVYGNRIFVYGNDTTGIYIGEDSTNFYASGNQINISSRKTLPIFIEGTELTDFSNVTIEKNNLVDNVYNITYNHSLTNYVFQHTSLEGFLICAGCKNVTYNNVTVNGSINLLNVSGDANTTTIIKNSSINGYNKIKGGLSLSTCSAVNITGNKISGHDIGMIIDLYPTSTVSRNLFIERNNFTNNNLALSPTRLSSNGIYLRNNYLFSNLVGYELVEHFDYLIFASERIINNTIGILVNVSDYFNYYNTFNDFQFANNTFDLQIDEPFKVNLTFINSSLNKSYIKIHASPSAIRVKWYVDVNIVDNNLNPVSNVNVTAYDSLGTLEDYNLTDAQGKVRLKVTEFFQEGETKYYLTPTSIKASKDNYTQNTTSINLYNRTYASANLTIKDVGCGSTLYSSLKLGNYYHCPNDGIIIGADSVTIDGQGHNFTGTGTNTGISANNKRNISIINLKINNFTKGIDLVSTDNSNFTNLIINNTDFGIIFNSSNNNVIYDSIISNNSKYSLITASDSNTINSLVNVSMDLNNMSISNAAQILSKWYVQVNATFTDQNGNSGNPLPSANASGYFNNTNELDHSIFSNSDGIAKLILTELKKNASGIYYQTPHNISIYFISISGGGINSTYINLTKTNNTVANLSLNLNCTAPLNTNNNIAASTLFCPGTFYVKSVDFTASSITLNCDSTTIKGYFNLETVNNINITNCSINYRQAASNTKFMAVRIFNTTNILIKNLTINSNYDGISCSSSSNFHLYNSSISSSYGYYTKIYLANCHGSSIVQNSFQSSSLMDKGIVLSKSNNNLIKNNTFNDFAEGISFISNYPSNNNTFYYNTFSSNSYNIYYFNASNTNYQNFNTSLNNYAQGNQYSDYCDMGSDLNNDGYADNVSSSATNDWPYSENITTKIYDPTVNNAGVIDYGPKITSCPEEEVFLTTRGGVTAAAAPAPAVAAEAPPAKPEGKITIKEKAPEAPPPITIGEVKKFLETKTTEIKTIEKVTKVKVVLENTGTKKMQLFPQLFQEAEETFFIITKKTLGFEGSSLSSLAGLAYSQDKIAGRLLKAEILDPEQIVLNPGEKIEKTLEIKEGLIAPRQIKIQFTTLGEVVKEQEVQIEQKALSGTAVDVDSEKALIDVYALILPQQLTKQLEEKSNGGITGAAVAEISAEPSSPYFLELSLNSREGKKTYFSDLYGPYQLKKEQVFVFAQQLKYDPTIYAGTYLVKTRIFQGEKSIVENKFEVDLGKEKPLVGYAAWPGFKGKAISLSWLWLSLAVLLFICFTSFYAYYLLRRQAQPKEAPLKIKILPEKKVFKIEVEKEPFLKPYLTKTKRFFVKNQKLFLLSLISLLLIAGPSLLVYYFSHELLLFVIKVGKTLSDLKLWLAPLIALLTIIILIFYLHKKKKEPPFQQVKAVRPLPKKEIVFVKLPKKPSKIKRLAEILFSKIKFVFKAIGIGLGMIFVEAAKGIRFIFKTVAKSLLVFLKALKDGLLFVFIHLLSFLDRIWSWPVKKVLEHKESQKSKKEEQQQINLVKQKEENKNKSSELSRFVLDSLAKGFSPLEIKENLLKAGWPARIVDNYLAIALDKFKEIKKQAEKEKIKITKTEIKQEKKLIEKRTKSLTDELNYLDNELEKIKTGKFKPRLAEKPFFPKKAEKKEPFFSKALFKPKEKPVGQKETPAQKRLRESLEYVEEELNRLGR